MSIATIGNQLILLNIKKCSHPSITTEFIKEFSDQVSFKVCL